MKKIILILCCLVLFSNRSFAFDKVKLETNIKKALNLTNATKLTIGDAVESDFAGLTKVMVSIGPGQYPVYLAPDEKKYFWGQVFDLTVDYDKDRMSKINLKGAHSKGSEKAPVTVVEFTDLQCPYCQKSHQALEALHKDFTKDQVRLVYKQFPLGMHDWAEKGSVATECAGQQSESAFWQLSDKIFENADKIKLATFQDDVFKYVDQLKLNKDKFKKCFDAQATLTQVKANREEGAAVGVGGTPTFFVNGRMLRSSQYEDLKTMISEKLSEAK